MSNGNKKYSTLFLDRDGVLNKRIIDGYVLQPAELVILTGIESFLKKAKTLFNAIVVVTNQRCIGRGMASLEEITSVNNKLNELTGNYIDAFYVCPHLDEDLCNCRKPKTGLFLQAMDDFEVDPQTSWLIGDSVTDLIPARSLQIKTVFISPTPSEFATKRYTSTLELLNFIQEL